MQKLMAIFAHPDDEGAMSGTLAHYAEAGAEVTLVCGTRGEVGEISDPALATAETLGAVREQELTEACQILGIRNLELLDYRDSGMVDTPENEDPRALVQADPEEFKSKIKTLLAKYEPDVVVTFEPFGWYGHPDHIAVSKWVTELFTTGESADRPTARLFHSVISFSRFSGMIKTAVAAGYMEETDFGGQPPRPEQLVAEASVTHVITTAGQSDKKSRAMLSHRTQFGPDHMFRKIPEEMLNQVYGSEAFIQVHPQIVHSNLFGE